MVAEPLFVVARNPQDDSRLRYLLQLPLGEGLLLKARERWPATARVYCHRFEDAWRQTPLCPTRRIGGAVPVEP